MYVLCMYITKLKIRGNDVIEIVYNLYNSIYLTLI